MSDQEVEVLNYLPSLRIQERSPDGPSDSDLLGLAKKNALDPSVFDEYKPYFFQGIISTNAYDAYSTSMHPSTLKSFAEDASTGVSYLRGHDNRADATGRSVRGVFVPGNGDGKARTIANWYVMDEPGSSSHLAKLRGGVVKDLSVGFSGGLWECSICGKDMSRGWWSREGCPHMLGVTYTPTDEAGKKSGDSKLATALIKSTNEQPTRLHEFSGVYDGATPGAMVTKAMELAGEGYFSDAERGIITARYRIALPERRILVSGGTRTAPDGAERIQAMPEENNTPPTAVRVEAIDALAGVRHLLKNAGVDETLEPAEAVRALSARVLELTPAAEDGKQYRTDLLATAEEECVRAGKDAEAYRAILVNLPINAIKRMAADWKAEGDKSFVAGRATTDPAEKGADAPQVVRNVLPDAGFRTGR